MIWVSAVCSTVMLFSRLSGFVFRFSSWITPSATLRVCTTSAMVWVSIWRPWMSCPRLFDPPVPCDCPISTLMEDWYWAVCSPLSPRAAPVNNMATSAITANRRQIIWSRSPSWREYSSSKASGDAPVYGSLLIRAAFPFPFSCVLCKSHPPNARGAKPAMWRRPFCPLESLIHQRSLAYHPTSRLIDRICWIIPRSVGMRNIRHPAHLRIV